MTHSAKAHLPCMIFLNREVQFLLFNDNEHNTDLLQQLMAGITGSMRAWLHSSVLWIYKVHQALRPQKSPINLQLYPLKHNELKCEIPNHQSHWQSSFSSRRCEKSHHQYSQRWLFISMCSAHAVIIHSQNRFGLMAQTVEAISKKQEAWPLCLEAALTYKQRTRGEDICALLCHFATEPLNDFWQLSLPLLLHSAYGDYSFMDWASLLSYTHYLHWETIKSKFYFKSV